MLRCWYCRGGRRVQSIFDLRHDGWSPKNTQGVKGSGSIRVAHPRSSDHAQVCCGGRPSRVSRVQSGMFLAPAICWLCISIPACMQAKAEHLELTGKKQLASIRNSAKRGIDVLQPYQTKLCKDLSSPHQLHSSTVADIPLGSVSTPVQYNSAPFSARHVAKLSNGTQLGSCQK